MGCYPEAVARRSVWELDETDRLRIYSAPRLDLYCVVLSPLFLDYLRKAYEDYVCACPCDAKARRIVSYAMHGKAYWPNREYRRKNKLRLDTSIVPASVCPPEDKYQTVLVAEVNGEGKADGVVRVL